MFHRAGGGPILAHANGIVGENVNDGKFHEGAQAKGAPGIIAEDQESGPIGPNLDFAQAIENGAMACSRTPKCRFRPPGFWADMLPAPSKVSRVLVEGARSADPPRIQGTWRATALRTLPEESRDGQSLGIGREAGQILVPFLGQLPVLHAR